MDKEKWKTIAIIVLILFIIENLIIGYGFYINKQEIEKQNMCFYDVCSESYDAIYENDICTCYDLDMLGDYMVTKEKYLK